MKKINYWLSEHQLKNIYTSDYWNNIEHEKEKGFWIADGNYQKCLDYLQSSNLLNEYNISEEFIIKFGLKNKNLIVADLAAGIGWTSVLLSKLLNIKEVHSVEISKHRLDFLFEHCSKMFEGENRKIYRYLGSFYDLKFKNKSIDIIFMSQAFHHAKYPNKLLKECKRVLRDNGRIILTGEHYIDYKTILNKILNNFKKNNFSIRFKNLFPPDEVLGDHYYRRSDYKSMFNNIGFSLDYKRVGKHSVIYVADRKTSLIQKLFKLKTS